MRSFAGKKKIFFENSCWFFYKAQNPRLTWPKGMKKTVSAYGTGVIFTARSRAFHSQKKAATSTSVQMCRSPQKHPGQHQEAGKQVCTWQDQALQRGPPWWPSGWSPALEMDHTSVFHPTPPEQAVVFNIKLWTSQILQNYKLWEILLVMATMVGLPKHCGFQTVQNHPEAPCPLFPTSPHVYLLYVLDVSTVFI